jgi:RNA polymerase sigma-70 factor (ECF subfamily)
LKKRKRLRSRFVSRDGAARQDAQDALDPREDIERADVRRRVRAAIDRLGADHRAVVVLRMIEGHSTRETAGILGIPEGTVMSRLARAMERLERDMKESSDG